MTTVTISVTQDDIDSGERMDPARCPVALAVTRILKDGYRAGVGLCTVGILDNRHDQVDISTLSQAVSDFISDFDAGVPVEPFTFTIEISEEYAR
jgi:hypothetical protein